MSFLMALSIFAALFFVFSAVATVLLIRSAPTIEDHKSLLDESAGKDAHRFTQRRRTQRTRIDALVYRLGKRSETAAPRQR